MPFDCGELQYRHTVVQACGDGNFHTGHGLGSRQSMLGIELCIGFQELAFNDDRPIGMFDSNQQLELRRVFPPPSRLGFRLLVAAGEDRAPRRALPV